MRYNTYVMHKFKVYLDTSIISAAIDEREPEKRKYTLRLIEEIKQGKYEAYISSVVLLEIGESDATTAKKLLSIIDDFSPEILSVSDEIEELAKQYIARNIIPVKYADDALHIAVASANALDIIISWNFEHIVKIKTIREAPAVNLLMGYKELAIYSPLEVVADV